MLKSDQANLLALCLIKDLNWHLIAREAQRHRGLDSLLNGDITEIKSQKAGTRPLLRNGLKKLSSLLEEVEERTKPAFEISARIVTVLDDDYPINLRSIFNLPPFLFYLGELREEDIMSVAVVGTRIPTPKGVRRARKTAALLAEQEVTVLSGLAKGIDTAAHQAALEVKGRTVAVMGTGICRVYPSENTDLAQIIVDQGGALTSQFWPTSSPASYTFPRRNITMSGLGQGTVVIEASSTSGAKMQARLALEHGKKVFLPKSLVENYQWARKYLERGAIQVNSPEAILEYLVSPTVIRSRISYLNQLRFALYG